MNKRVKGRITARLQTTLNVTIHGKEHTYTGGGIRRLFNHINKADKKKDIKIKVIYGRFKDVWGKETEFNNEYIGNNKIEARHALQAFTEDFRLKTI